MKARFARLPGGNNRSAGLTHCANPVKGGITISTYKKKVRKPFSVDDVDFISLVLDEHLNLIHKNQSCPFKGSTESQRETSYKVINALNDFCDGAGGAALDEEVYYFVRFSMEECGCVKLKDDTVLEDIDSVSFKRKSSSLQKRLQNVCRMTSTANGRDAALTHEDIDFISRVLDAHIQLIQMHHSCPYNGNTVARQIEDSYNVIARLNEFHQSFGRKGFMDKDIYYFIYFSMDECGSFKNEGSQILTDLSPEAFWRKSKGLMRRLRGLCDLPSTHVKATAPPPRVAPANRDAAQKTKYKRMKNGYLMYWDDDQLSLLNPNAASVKKTVPTQCRKKAPV